MRLDRRQLRLHLLDAHLGRGEILFLRARGTDGAFGLVRRNGLALEQVLLPPRVGAQKVQLRSLGFGVVLRLIDLRQRDIALRAQFSRIQLDDNVAGGSTSPSCFKIFSTRPPERGPTCVSSTSIVPETALLL